ncbi:hypothetical protein ERX46_06690 [Brumimicrobium glaciale]|uniref:Flippase-like domain-containing protein n=1 Tax=Brumimicrobium glaciale TaxID=200475 RepID=A0A4V1WG09_9FLAO|nr:hypothetical protein ERX46_06690 [Brumimicrobium glaciale]
MLFIGVLYFFVQQLSRIEFNQFQSLKIENPIWFILVLFFLPLNWGLELFKWQRILKVNQISYSLKDLTHSLFSGVTTGIITPNRIGNFIGRMLFFKGKVRGQLILGTLYSNFAQFIVTLIFGGIGFLFLFDFLLSSFGNAIVSVLIVIFVLSILFYFAVPFVPLSRIKFLNKKQNILIQFQKQSIYLVFPLLTISGMRYLVFSTQFLFMLMAFGISPSFMLYAGIFLVYLVSTLTPSLLFGKLIIRETAGLIILSLFVENDAIIVISSLLLWFINLGIPSLLGLVFIIRKKTIVNA